VDPWIGRIGALILALLTVILWIQGSLDKEPAMVILAICCVRL
jgi:hypothetical protein